MTQNNKLKPGAGNDLSRSRHGTPASMALSAFLISLVFTSAGCPDLVTLPAINSVPVADASGPRDAVVGQLVRLSARSSMDPDGDPLNYRWQQLAGPPVTLSPSTDIEPEFTVSAEGMYEFALTVDDGRGGSDKDTVSVDVGRAAPPQGPLADAGDDQSIFEERPATLWAGNSTAADGGTLSYAWEQVSGPDTSLTGQLSVEATFVAPDVESDSQLIFRLTVTDDAGRSDTDTVVVFVRNMDTGDPCAESDRYGDGICDQDCARPDPDCDPSPEMILCHIPAGDPDNAHTVLVGEASVDAHLAHGDRLGPCDCDYADPSTCDDGDACTNHRCVEGACVVELIDCDDGNACTEDRCVEGHCEHVPVVCDDGKYCNGAETCDPNTGDCVAGQPVVCGDGMFCNGVETCDDDADACAPGEAPCAECQDCDESAEACVDLGQLVIGHNTTLMALTMPKGTMRWQVDAGFDVAMILTVRDGDSSVIMASVGGANSQTAAFDACTGTRLWALPYNMFAFISAHDAAGRLYTDPLRYPHGSPDLGCSSAPDIVLFSGGPSSRTTYVVDTRTGGVVCSHQLDATTRGFQFIPTTGGSYDIMYVSDSYDMLRVDGNTCQDVVWAQPYRKRWGIPVPDVTGDGQPDFFGAPSYYNDQVMMIDGAGGAIVWNQPYNAFDVLGGAVLEDGLGLGVVASAQGSSRGGLRRYDAFNGTEICTCPSAYANNTIMGLLERTDGLTVVSGWRHQGKAVAMDAATCEILWDDVAANMADAVGIGVPDLTGDGNDDFIAQNNGWLRLYDGVSGQEQSWFAPIQGSSVAYLTVP